MPLAALIWPWAYRYGGGPGRRLRRWMVALVLCGVGYLVYQAPLFLVLAFSVLVGSVADLGIERADIAGANIRARFEGDVE